MMLFRRIVFSAALAGTAAALLLTLLQALWVTPLILQAETYEAAAEALPHTHSGDELAEAAAWQPEDGWQRTASTAISNILMAIGFGLMLTGSFALRQPAGIRHGLAWGLAGYAVFFAAPGLGLPPELPGTVAANLVDRQQWWLGAVLATAGGLALLALQQRWLSRLSGLVLLALPHLVGAPQPAVPESLAPDWLQSQFHWATSISQAAFWLMLGWLSAWMFGRFANSES